MKFALYLLALAASCIVSFSAHAECIKESGTYHCKLKGDTITDGASFPLSDDPALEHSLSMSAYESDGTEASFTFLMYRREGRMLKRTHIIPEHYNIDTGKADLDPNYHMTCSEYSFTPATRIFTCILHQGAYTDAFTYHLGGKTLKLQKYEIISRSPDVKTRTVFDASPLR